MQKGLLAAAVSAGLLSCTLLLTRPAPRTDAVASGTAEECGTSGATVTLSSRISHPRVLAGERQEVFLHVALLSCA